MVISLDWEDPLENEMETHSSILACRIPWPEEPGGLQYMGSQRVEHNWVTSTLGLSWAQMVKNMPAMLKTWVRSLGWEDLPEKGMGSYSSILAWRIPWTREPDGLPSMGSQRVTTERLSLSLSFNISQLVLYLQQVECEKQPITLPGRSPGQHCPLLMKANAWGFGDGSAAPC